MTERQYDRRTSLVHSLNYLLPKVIEIDGGIGFWRVIVRYICIKYIPASLISCLKIKIVYRFFFLEDIYFLKKSYKNFERSIFSMLFLSNPNIFLLYSFTFWLQWWCFTHYLSSYDTCSYRKILCCSLCFICFGSDRGSELGVGRSWLLDEYELESRQSFTRTISSGRKYCLSSSWTLCSFHGNEDFM